MIGTKLANRYEILRELGRGGMGVVYLANDPVLDREVAIKVITPDMVSPETAERFRREARVVAKMDHPAIVSVHDSGEHEGALFFVMPLVEGTNLRTLLRNQSMRLGQLVDLAIQVAEALEYSHSRGIVHRDIKPENIMVTTKESEGVRVRVMDFGLAMASTQDRITRTATVVGTVAYMSPEQVTGREVDARSDIYSFGTVLYECLVGQTPFAGEVQALVYRISHELPLPLKSLQTEVDEEVEEIILRCLEKEPVKRPTGKEIVESLSSYRAKLQGSGRQESMLPTASHLGLQAPRRNLRPFVGRDKEFAEMQRRLHAAIAGECQFVLVGGEAGIGKSRLLEELESLAKVRNILVLHGRFIEIEHSLPYQGYGEAVQDYFRNRSSTATPVDFSDLSSDLVSLFPVLAEIRELAGSSGESEKATEGRAKKFEDRTTIFEVLARTLTRMAGGQPMVLLMEDLHAADVSLEALDYMVRRLGPTPTLIVGTYRSTEIDKKHRLSRLLGSFKGERRFGQILLGPMSASDHRLFLEKLIGGQDLEEFLARKFFEATEGNPYFTTELVRSLVDSGAIIRDDTGGFHLSSETALSLEELPATIQQAVEERIERLPENLRELLSLASVLGRTFEFIHLETLAVEQTDLEAAVEQLSREGFIEEDRQSRTDRLSFSSGVLRDVLYASLPRRRRRSLHRKHAEELEKRNQGRLERVYPQLFEHYVQADVPEKVMEYGFLLAKKSLGAFSPEDCIRVTQTVIDFLEDDAGNPIAKAEAKMLLASAHRMTGNTAAALKELDEAVRLYEEDKQNSRSLECIVLAADIAWHGLKVDDTRRWVDRGLHLARNIGDTTSLPKLLSLAATVANLRGEYKKAQEYLEDAERLKPPKEEVAQPFVSGGVLSVALANPCEVQLPANVFTNEEAEVLANVFETLVTTDAQGNLVPHLCERWETLNEGAMFLFVLRKDIRLHDGRRMMAPEVKASFEQGIRRATRATPPAFAPIRGVAEFLNGAASQVSGVIALSENIVEIQLNEKIPIYPALLTDLRTAIAVPGSRSDEFAGTGPFRLASFRPENVVLERNPEYWKGANALVDSIRFQARLNSTEIADGFRAGKFDLVRDLLPEDLDEILRESRLHAGLAETPQKNVYFVLFNNSSALGQIPTLRQALAGIARMHDLVPSTVGRFAQPAQGLLPPGILGHDPGKRSVSMSMDKAKELIQSAGLSLPVRMRASVQPVLQDRYGVLTRALFKLWSEIGVEISIQTPDQATFNDTWLRNEAIDLLIGRWIGDYDDPDTFTYSLFHSQIGELRKYYSSTELDVKMEKARMERQPEIRERLYREIETFLMHQEILHPLFHDIDYRVAGSSVQRLALSNTPPFVNYSSLAKTEKTALAHADKSGQGILRVPIWGDIHSLDPSLTITGAQATVFPAVFETLTRAADGARIAPWLASSFQAEEGGRRFRFHLRDGVKFHDGRRLTARDVRFSFERLLQTKGKQNSWLFSPIRGADRLIKGESTELEGFRIISSQEFVVEFDKPLSLFPAILAYTPTAILPEGTAEIFGNWRSGCIGTGPFRVIDFEPGSGLKVEANPSYWIPGIPRTDGIEFIFPCSPAQILAGFRSGRFHVAWNLVPSDAETLLHEAEFASKYQEIPSLSTQYMAMNVRKGPLADEVVRQRFVESVDWDGLTRRKLGRFVFPARTLTPPSLLGYEAPQRTRSTPSAKKTLEPVELTLALHSVYLGKYESFTKELLEILREKGFIIRVLEGKLEDSLLQNAECDLRLSNWIADYPDPDTFLYGLLHSKSGIIGDLCGIPETDRLLERARTETDFVARQSLYRQVEDIILKRHYVVPLFHEQNYCFLRPEVSGAQLNFFDPILPFEKISLRM